MQFRGHITFLYKILTEKLNITKTNLRGCKLAGECVDGWVTGSGGGLPPC